LTNPNHLRKFGTILIVIGMLAWVPYFLLRINGESPSLLVFLPFHLLGVVGGARMRKTANKQLDIPIEKRKGYKRIAHYLVIASLLVWIPYSALKFSGRPVELSPFLTVHLVGILGVTGLLVTGTAVKYIHERRQV
jgi:hypothetical protein